MAQTVVPHYVNDKGVDRIKIGVKEFQCMGASPPFDHPHVFLDMGSGTQLVCPYCSTLYIYDPELAPEETEPEACVYVATEPAGA
ncbi:zinc-finger domain-containing protein [Methyloligella solikamskensis]|uniref:Zinc-finger domain-containing protein n=1 Tax=Methyloligella solikamskensis TaxID=1177756 RepID=A0ABW3JA82_9HYPH